MTDILFLLIKKTVKDINHNSKEYYLLKLQDYDNLVSDNKEKKINTKIKEKVISSDLTPVKETNEKVFLESNPEYQIRWKKQIQGRIQSLLYVPSDP